MAALALGVGAVVAAAFGPVLSSRALWLDDTYYLTDNVLVRDPSWASASRFFAEVLKPSTVPGYYQPLTMVSLMLDVAAGGSRGDLAPFHRTALALHAANSALLVVFLWLLFGNASAAALTGLLFGLHPLTVESVAWIAERKTQLATFFALMSLIAYARWALRGGARAYAACVLAYVLALLAKPTVTTLPVLLLVLDAWPLGRLGRRALLEKLPLLAIGAAAAVVTVISQARSAQLVPESENTPFQIVLTLAFNIVYYVYRVLWPADVQWFMPFPLPFDLSNPRLLTAVIAAPLLVVALLVLARRTRAPLAGWLFMVVALLPTMGVVGFTVTIVANRYAYFASLGLWLLVAAVASHVFRQPRPVWRRTALAGLMLAAASLEATLTRRCLRDWRDDDALSRAALTQSPDSTVLLDVRGTYLLNAGRAAEAEEHYRAARRASPQNIKARHNLVQALLTQGKLAAAEEELSWIVAAQPDHAAARQQLARLLAAQGRLDRALPHFEHVLRCRPDDADAAIDLGGILRALGRGDESAAAYERALRLRPGELPVMRELADLLLSLGRRERALSVLQAIIKLDPADAAARAALVALSASQASP